MKLIYTFLRESKGLVTIAIAAAFLSGVLSTAVVALIHSLADDALPPSSEALGKFLGLCALVIAAQLLSEFLLLRLSQDTVFSLRVKMSRRILSAPLRRLEQLGTPRLLATITGDVNSVSQAVTLSPLLCMYVAIIFASMGYMLWLDWQVFIGFIIFFGAGLFIYWAAAKQGERFISQAREDSDTLFSALRGLTEGAKELKLNLKRRESFLTRLLEAPAESVRAHNVQGHMTYRSAGVFGRMIFLGIFGLLLFLVPRVLSVETSTITGYIIALLYMNMPLTGLFNTLPTLGAARVALRKIQSLGLTLEEETEPMEWWHRPGRVDGWSSVRLEGVAHTYYREVEDDRFTLGPIDLEVRPGELLFVVGGNGSGKTTLAKILTGLYVPEGGRIRIDGRVVDDETLDEYRQHFSMVFTNFYLFDELLGFEEEDGLDQRAREYIERLHLHHKVQVKEGKLSTTDLSQGQRKRLALLNAYLEDRPIYVFDEWAADQDPVFKEVFYRQLLPELRERGKAVVVISHDDRYYDVADRIVKLEEGKLAVPQSVPTGSRAASR